MKKLAAIIIGTALLVGCSSKPVNKKGYEDYTIANSFKDSGIDAKIALKFNNKNYTKEEVRDILERHLYAAMTELEEGAKSEFLKKYLKEFHLDYVEDSLELIMNEEIYKKKLENEIGEKSM